MMSIIGTNDYDEIEISKKKNRTEIFDCLIIFGAVALIAGIIVMIFIVFSNRFNEKKIIDSVTVGEIISKEYVPARETGGSVGIGCSPTIGNVGLYIGNGGSSVVPEKYKLVLAVSYNYNDEDKKVKVDKFVDKDTYYSLEIGDTYDW